MKTKLLKNLKNKFTINRVITADNKTYFEIECNLNNVDAVIWETLDKELEYKNIHDAKSDILKFYKRIYPNLGRKRLSSKIEKVYGK